MPPDDPELEPPLESPLRALIALAWPAMLQGLVTTLVLFTDRLLLGRYSTEAIGSMTVSGPLVWSIFSVFGAFAAGVVAVIGRSVGARDRERAARTLRAVVGLAAGAGIAVAVAGVGLRHPIAELLAGGSQTSPQVRAMAVDYLGIVLAAAPLSLLSVATATALQAGGDTRSPMWAAGLAGALNLLVSWLLIYGVGGLPELGVVGAAIGTTVAMSTYSLVTLVALRVRRRAPTFRDDPGECEPGWRRRALRPVLRVAMPALGEKLLYHGAYLGFVAMIGHLGDVPMAAHQALIAIESIGFIAADALGIAAGALVAQRLGAGRADEAATAGWLAAGLGALVLSGVSLLFLVAAEPLIGLFTSDTAVIEVGARCLRVAAIAQPLMAATDALAGALRGAGETRSPMMAALVGPVVVRLSACWVLAYPLGLGLLGIWIGSTLDWAVRTVWLTRAFRRGSWRTCDLSTS